MRSIKYLFASLLGLICFLMVSPFAHADTSFDLNKPLGTVEQQQSMMLPTALQPFGTGKRVWYVSSDVSGNRQIVSGAIITPNSHTNPPRVVAWAHGTTGFDPHCAPSQNLDVFWPEAVDAVKSYLQQGWTVAATDYQGLGTGATGPSQFAVGETEARSVIDSVHAAQNLDGNLSNQYVISGHSEGGQAALFAGQIAGTYGTGMKLKGLVALAPASNFDLLAQGILGTPGQGYIVMGLYGLNAVDPSVIVNNVLAQPAINLESIVHTGCLEEVLGAYQNLTPDQMVVGGSLPNNLITEIGHYGSPAQQPNTYPILLLQGTADQTIPPSITGLLQQEICSYTGAKSYLQYIDGVDHDTLPTQTINIVSDYINARFSGQTPQNNCN